MTQLAYVAVALFIGLGSAVQTGLLGALGRQRGPSEAAWVSLLGSVTGLAAVLLVRSLRGDSVQLPSPLDRPEAHFVALALAGGALAISLRGAEPYYAITGLFGVAFIAGAAYLVPNLGVALFFGLVTTGSVMGALYVDHVGAFGAARHSVSVTRVAGLALLLLGVVVVRSDT